MSQTALNEQLLATWLGLSAVLRNDRFMRELSFNEAFICGLTERQRQDNPAHPFLAMGELCRQTRMLKSQVHRVISGMEQKGLATRHRAPHDKRVVYVGMTDRCRALYAREHARILTIVDYIINDLGTDDIVRTIQLLDRIIGSVDRYIKQGENI